MKWCVLSIVLFCSVLFAHESRPIFLSLTQMQPNTYHLTWKMPVGGLMQGDIKPNLPGDCHARGQNGTTLHYANIQHQMIVCDQPLHNVSIHDLNKNLGLSALVRVTFLSGEQHSKILTNTDPIFVVPQQENKWSVFVSYTKLGIEHILIGLDHLLFLLCLLFITRNLVLAITGFTVAHSITLALSVLDIVRLPSAWVETCIALSIVFLAAEVVRNQRDSLIYQHPFVVTFGFGLLHGFGFADVLRDIGLPQSELALGLLAFNIGIEIGQLMFIGGALLVTRWLRIPHSVSFVIGIIAAFWVIERATGFL